ncbi:MAG: 3-dehydroquinate synthase [Gammaproteobacteria bacterium]|nr:3-dehydroquinate synthase [Gammaproteobacteria bacterium]
MRTLTVDLRGRSYPIYIGESILSAPLLSQHITNSQVFIVTNTTVAPLYLNTLKQSLSDYACDEYILPDGEEHKTLATLSLLFDALIMRKHRRNTTLIALGGGVVGDITGFAAACYQRGVAYLQIPTTLLSQVDSSIGGKTAVNHVLAKNMIGAFYQPSAVLIDIVTLQTLPDREFYAGLAEIIKVALIADEGFFAWLEINMPNILNKERSALMYAIEKACAIKVNIVEADEKEVGVRVLLNLGHTFGHALEHALGYGEWLHGEAVATGIVLAASYSLKLGLIDTGIFNRIKNILTMAKLPIRLPNSLSAGQMIEPMNADKKKDTHQLKLVLLQGIGQAVICSNIDLKLLEATIIENQL